MTRRFDTSGPVRAHNLTRDAVASAALDVIDRGGLSAVTMRAIAERVGVRAQSLYTHVSSHDDLLDAVADHMVNNIDTDPHMNRAATEAWQHHLTGAAHAVRCYARRHPTAFVLFATQRANLTRSQPPILSDRWSAHTLAVLTRSGFDGDEITLTYRAFHTFLLGSLLLETRDMVTRPRATAESSVTGGQTDSPAAVGYQGLFAELANRHDDAFVTDLDDVLNRITNRTRGQDPPHRGTEITTTHH